MSMPHILTLAVIAVVCICAALLYRKLPVRGQNIAGLCVGIILPLFDILHYFDFANLGMLWVGSLPFHLCGLSVYMCLLHSIFKADWMGQSLYVLCLPGVWSALLFPDWTNFPLLSTPSLYSFIMHSIISMYIIMQLAAGRIRPRLSAIWKPAIFIVAAAIVAGVINHFYKTNFMFLNYPAPGSPLEFIAKLSGGSHALYLLFFGILALIVMTILYLPFSIYRLYKQKEKP